MKASVPAFCLILFLAGVAAGADSLNVRLVGRCSTPQYAFGLAVTGDHAYVADLTARLRVVSISDPSHVLEVGYCDTPAGANGVCVNGEYAYVADGDSGLRVISIADPEHPVETGCWYSPGYARAAAAAGDYVYVADLFAGVRIVSVSDPAHPVEVGCYDTPGFPNDVAVEGNYAYVAADTAGLRVVSVADPANPVEIGHCDTPGAALGVAVTGDYAYVADGDSGLRVISVADPANPSYVGDCHTPGRACGVCVFAARGRDPGPRPDCAYVANYRFGLRVISLADPANPVEVGYYRTPGLALGVAVDGDCVFLAESADGMDVFELFGVGVEDAPYDEVGAPGGMSSVVKGVLRLSPSADLKPQAASLLDAAGRKVTELEAGANDVSPLAPGVYFVRKAEAQEQAVRKVVVIR